MARSIIAWSLALVLAAIPLAAAAAQTSGDQPAPQVQDRGAQPLTTKEAEAKARAEADEAARVLSQEPLRVLTKEDQGAYYRQSTREYYTIGPSDLLEIIVWKEVAISRNDVLVRPDGRISLPLVDDVLAAGLTPMELKEKITKNLRKYIEMPQVYVTVKDPRSQFCAILGNVKQPGHQQMLTPTTVLQAISMAGGFNEWADKDDVVVLRGYGTDQIRLPFAYSEVVEGKNMRQNTRLQPGDVIIVP